MSWCELGVELDARVAEEEVVVVVAAGVEEAVVIQEVELLDEVVRMRSAGIGIEVVLGLVVAAEVVEVGLF